MTLTLYPIATDVDTALKAGVKVAARESEAQKLASAHVVFASEWVGPAYDSRDAALDAWAGRVEDDREGHGFSPAPEARFCKLICRPASLGAKDRKSREKTGTVWQLSVSYWKIMAAPQASARPAKEQARKVRKSAKAKALTPEEVRELAQAPLMPYRLQKGLDFGLFDYIPPDNPNIVIADE